MRTHMNRMPAALAVAVATATAAALALAGCTATPHTILSSTPTATAQPGGLVPIADGTVAATADFGEASAIRGAITVVKQGDDYRLKVTGLQVPADADLAVSSQLAATSPGCFDRWRLSLGEPATWSGAGDVPSSSIGLHIGSLVDPASTHPDLLDPTFLDTVVVTEPKASGSCQLTTLGTATLTWSVPTLRPQLVATDGGPIKGAQGTVTPSATGSPLSYTVAPGDTISQVAARFHLKAEDLYYLNPISDTTYQNPVLYAADTINLNVLSRGLATVTGH